MKPMAFCPGRLHGTITQRCNGMELHAGDGNFGTGNGVRLGIVRVLQCNAEMIGAGLQVPAAGNKAAHHLQRVVIGKVVYDTMGMFSNTAQQDAHIKPGIVSDDGTDRKQWGDVWPKLPERRGMKGVLRRNAMDADVKAVVLV